jgi:hypothetical protein
MKYKRSRSIKDIDLDLNDVYGTAYNGIDSLDLVYQTPRSRSNCESKSKYRTRVLFDMKSPHNKVDKYCALIRRFNVVHLPALCAL